MASFSFLHAADIHLDSPLAGLSRYDGVPADQVRAAPRAAFDRLIDTAIERRVDFIVIAGDLYDRDWPDIGTGLYFAAAMGKLGRAGIPLYLLAGNHDAVITKIMPAIGNVQQFPTDKPGTHVIEHLNVAIHGRSFAERSVRDNLAAGYPEATRGAFNIGVLHTSLSGYSAHETYAPCTPQELAAKRYQYWALGHVHEHEVVSTDPHIVFPGNLQGRHIREAGPRGAMLVQVCQGEVSTLERLELDVVRWASVAVDVGAAADLNTLHDAIRAALRSQACADRPTVVRLTLTGRTPLHGALQDVSRRLRDDVRGIAAELRADLWIERICVETAAPAQITHADPDDLLIPEPDADLAQALRDDCGKFLASLPTLDPESTVRQAQQGEWAKTMQAAFATLGHRLKEAR